MYLYFQSSTIKSPADIDLRLTDNPSPIERLFRASIPEGHQVIDLDDTYGAVFAEEGELCNLSDFVFCRLKGIQEVNRINCVVTPYRFVYCRLCRLSL